MAWQSKRVSRDFIAIAGDSAGGNLAVVICQLARQGGPKIALQALLCPVMDALGHTDSLGQTAENLVEERYADDGEIAAGVDLISSGWITHSAPILDLGLDTAN